jgi:hypothetical protein
MAGQSLGVREAGQRITLDDALGILWNRRELYALAGVSMDARTKMTTRKSHEVAETVSDLELLARQSRLGWTVFGNEDIQPE